MPSNSENYVYLYRDSSGNPVYVGQGKNPARAISLNRREAFLEWLTVHKGKYKLEIIGPLDSPTMADAIETSIISACLPAPALKLFNIHPGRSRFQFRPFGVPAKYVERTATELSDIDLKSIVEKFGNILFVRINQVDFTDGPGRRGYDLANPPSDGEIRARIESWWQLANRLERWSSDPRSSPALLVGVTGGPKSQSVIGSALIDRKKWGQALKGKNGLITVPLKGLSLDAGKLRGVRIAPEVGLKFGSFRQQQFRIYGPQGLNI